MPPKEEFPPLLAAGFHQKTICELCEMSVRAFQEKSSRTRPELMCGLQIVVRTLVEGGIQGDLWVGNSFVTQKVNPRDIDLFLWVDGKYFDNATARQREILEWFHSNLEESHGCDTKLWVNYDGAHPEHGESQWWRASCQTIFGFYHPEGPNVHEMKGIALLKLPGCTDL